MNPHRRATPRALLLRFSILVLTVAVTACRPEPTAGPEPTPVPDTPGTARAPLDTPTRFDEVALVGTAACSSSGYSLIDNCYNEQNPQRPSIFRELTAAYRPAPTPTAPMTLKPAALNGVMLPFPPFEYSGAWSGLPRSVDSATAQQVPPFQRGTNDGRLYVRGGCRGCAEGSTLFTFRPELLRQDLRYDFATNGTKWAQPQRAMGLHPLVYFNPVATSLAANNNGNFPDALHSTLCEDSVTSFDAQGHGRNPVACQARYESTGALYSGDCYDVSLVYGLKGAMTSRWELRSVQLTVFVRSPKSRLAGDTGTTGPESWGIWVYPRNPTGEVKSLPLWELPPFRPFNVHETPWNDLGPSSAWTVSGTQDIDWWNLFTQHPGFKCYTPVTKLGRTTYVRDTSPAAPKWCQFFDRQSSISSVQVEDDEDTNPDNGGTWNGVNGTPAPGGQERPYSLFEPTTSGDGRLLVINLDGLYYAYSQDACRAAGWSHFRPISMMPMDPAVNARYELAKSQVVNGTPRPFRDTLGNAIPFGVRNFWAYPWLDREAKNLFFAAKNNPHDGYYARQVTAESLYDGSTLTNVASGVPATDADRARFNPDRGPAQAVSVLGAWTHGKAVILDNGLSISDLGGNNDGGLKRTYALRLYAGADLSVVPSGTSQLFSFENQLNHFDALRPTLPFDVVWNVQSNTQRTSQVAFDDYLNKRAFVVAHMNAAIRMDVSPHGASRAETFPQDGFTPQRDIWAYVRGGGVADFRFTRNPLAQNAATGSPLFGTDGPQPPASLRLRGGARIEPVALGGVSGKGVWLDGINDFMDMGYPVAASQRDWLLGIWLDSRQDAMLKPGATVARSLPRTIFFFSDNSWVGLVRGRDSSGGAWHELVLYNGATGVRQTVGLGSLVDVGRYFHLGLKLFVEGGQRKVAVSIDGTSISTTTVATTDVGFDPMYNSVNGWTWMTVGDPGPALFVPSQARLPFYGWVDELRIFALSPGDAQRAWTEELLCNEALGTLVDVGTLAGEVSHPALTALRERAARNPTPVQHVCEQLRLETYVDPADYPAQYGERLCVDRVHKNPRPEPTLAARCLRATRLQLPVLQAALPRPDTSGNAFCLSCHTGTAPLPGLRLGALTAGTGPREQDPRRQPMNVPAVMGGFVPPWLTAGTDLPDGTHTLDAYFDHHLAP